MPMTYSDKTVVVRSVCITPGLAFNADGFNLHIEIIVKRFLTLRTKKMNGIGRMFARFWTSGKTSFGKQKLECGKVALLVSR